MTRQDFIAKLDHVATLQPNLAKSDLYQALEYLEVNAISEPYRNEHIRWVVQLAGSLSEKREVSNKQPIELPPSSSDDITRITIEVQAKAVDPEVKQLRKAFFGTDTPPGKGIAAKASEEIQVTVVLDRESLAKQLGDGFKEFLVDASKLSGTTVQIKEAIGFPRQGTDLHRKIENLAESVGWEYPVMKNYVITGEILPWPRAIATFIAPSRALAPHVEIKIAAKDLTFDELRQLYNGIREALKLTKNKPPTEKDIVLYRFFEQRCPDVFKDGKMRGYQKLHGDWNKEYPRRAYKKGTDSIRKQLEKIVREFNAYHLLGEASEAKERQVNHGNG